MGSFSMTRAGYDSDVIVLGTGLGGLATASLLARRGISVLVLQEAGYEASFRRDGYRFCPFSSFSERRSEEAVLRKISRALGVSLPEEEEKERPRAWKPGISPKTAPPQVILPEMRIDCHARGSLQRREWAREFPFEAASIDAFWHDLARLRGEVESERGRNASMPFFPLWDRTLGRLVRSFLDPEVLFPGRFSRRLALLSDDFREFLRIYLLGLTGFQTAAMPVSLAAYLLGCEEDANGGGFFDLEAWEEEIFDLMAEAGGTREEIGDVEAIRREGDGWTLDLAEERRTLRCRTLVLNSPLHYHSSLQGGWRAALEKWSRRIRPGYVLYPLFLGILDRVVPVGMGEEFVSVLDPGRPWEGGNLLLVGLSSAGDETQAPSGRRALSAQALIPWQRWDPQELPAIEGRMMAHLRSVIPFLDEHTEFRESSWAEAQISRWSYPHFIYETAGRFAWRLGLLPVRLGRGLFLAGRERFPYFGREGEILTGEMAGHVLLSEMGKGHKAHRS
jgi:phytoene dehydrogenase-like protein